jgi:superoxide dismutase, Cu-Zn family
MKLTKLCSAAASILLISFIGIGCQSEEFMKESIPEKIQFIPEEETERDMTEAVAVLHPTEGSQVHGTVTFTQVENGIKIVADVKGLSPGKHGFHIHEYGDCTAPDGTSAGGHFNPENMPHGAPTDMKRHVGDLGNLEADEEGWAHYERVDEHVALSGPHSIIGLAVIVHQDEDDFSTQPTGAAGSRMACGIIGIANPNK